MDRSIHRGFSLAELLIVISIIGVLSTVVISSTSISRSRARDVRRIGDLKEVQLALALYYDVNRSYPLTLSTLLSDKYLPSIPTDPDPSKSYEYQLNGIRYCIGALLESTAPTDIPDFDCSIPSSSQGNTTDSWFKQSR